MKIWKASILVVTLLVLAASSIGTARPTFFSHGGQLPGAVPFGGERPPTVLYTLEDTSVFISGCFPAPPFPCGGPLILYPHFGGMFGLTVAGKDPEGFELYEISQMLLIAGVDDHIVVVMGSGEYRRRPGEDAQHEMTLYVTVDGTPSIFGSGLVPLPETDDEIDIAVNMNDLINYDTLMRIVANP